jgi:1,4-dihydroxy-2-naphthoate octaprenyltransferase
MDAALVAVVTYAVLSVLWGTIFALYLRSRRLVRGDALIAMLLTVLALDAFKSLVESIYFGILWGGNRDVSRE